MAKMLRSRLWVGEASCEPSRQAEVNSVKCLAEGESSREESIAMGNRNRRRPLGRSS